VGSFPQLHTIGSLTFFSISGSCSLREAGRLRVCCPCVTARETIGFPFRDKTVRKTVVEAAHLKWLTLGLLVVYLALMVYDASTAYNRAGKYFYGL